MFVAIAVAAAVGCGTQESAPAQTGGAPAATTTGTASGADITFKSDPESPRTGDNTFEVMVMQDGKPVDDATVSVEFFMAAMPQMNMAEMRNKTDLKPAGNGVYRGNGQVVMAGSWDVTVMAMRNGQEIGSRKLTVTAR
jgi:hypothetical protein